MGILVPEIKLYAKKGDNLNCWLSLFFISA